MDIRKVKIEPISTYLLSSGSGMPIPSLNLEVYLDARTDLGSYSGSGTTWTDISGNSRNFSWDASPSYVSGSAAHFNTNGRFASGPASNSVGINNTSGYTVMLLAFVISNESTGAFRFSSTDGGRGIFSHLPWGDNNIYFDQGGCCNPDTRTSVGSGGANSWNLWTFRRQTSGSTRDIVKNNSILTTNTNAAANINLGSQVIRINNTFEYGANWNARIGAFITYSRSISNAEIEQIYNYYKPIYGLP